MGAPCVSRGAAEGGAEGEAGDCVSRSTSCGTLSCCTLPCCAPSFEPVASLDSALRRSRRLSPVLISLESCTSERRVRKKDARNGWNASSVSVIATTRERRARSGSRRRRLQIARSRVAKKALLVRWAANDKLQRRVTWARSATQGANENRQSKLDNRRARHATSGSNALFALASLSLRSRFALASLTLRFALASLSLRSRFALAAPSLCARSTPPSPFVHTVRVAHLHILRDNLRLVLEHKRFRHLCFEGRPGRGEVDGHGRGGGGAVGGGVFSEVHGTLHQLVCVVLVAFKTAM